MQYFHAEIIDSQTNEKTIGFFTDSQIHALDRLGFKFNVIAISTLTDFEAWQKKQWSEVTSSDKQRYLNLIDHCV